MYFYRVLTLLPLRDRDYELAPVGELKIGERTAVGIRVSHKGRRDINLFLDKETGRLLKSETRAKDVQAGKEFTQETLYSEYKEVDGVPVAHKFIMNRDGKPFLELEMSDYKAHEKLDDSTFGKP
jgi:hypothetical protein